MILSQVTGSPAASAAALLVFSGLLDRYTLGLLPDPFRFVGRLRRQWRLERHLALAPHDRKTRAELGELYLAWARYAKALEVLRPALEAGDEDAATVFAMGVACLGARHKDQGEKLLAHVLESQPSFRNGEVHLALGRFRLRRRDFAGAKQALEQLLALRAGSVEGRVLLAQALAGLNEGPAAARTRAQAWAEHVAAPRFQQRRQRLWAWRARPSRPLLYAAALALVALAAWRAGLPALPALPLNGRPSSLYDDGLPVPVVSYRSGNVCTEVRVTTEAAASELERAAREAPPSSPFEVARAGCSEAGAVAVCEARTSGSLRFVWYGDAANAAQSCKRVGGVLTAL